MTDGGGVSEGISYFWVCLEGGTLFCGGEKFSVAVHAQDFSWVLISVRYVYMSLGSIGSGETALVGRPAGREPLWGFCVLVFVWEVAAVFFVVGGVSRLSSHAQGGVLGTDLHEVLVF